MQARAAISALLLMVPLAASADVVGFKVGAYGWSAGPSGWIQDDNSANSADLERDLNLDSQTTPVIWGAIEHPLPVLPNLKLQYTPVSLEGSGNIGQSFVINGTTYAANAQVDSKLDLHQTDVILYWEALDNVVDLDLGVNFKVVNGSIEATTPGQPTQSEDFVAPVPMVYANLVANLPFNLDIGVEGSWISYGGNRLMDAKASIGYTIASLVNIEGGYRQQQLKLDDIGGVSADIKIGGPYVGASLRF